MRVRCIENRGSGLTPPYYSAEHGRPDHQTFNLTVGRSYVVYAMGLNGPGTWLYLADDVYVDGPRRYPLCLFEVESGCLSRSWTFSAGLRDSDHAEMLAPAEWLQMPWFFNRLVDGDDLAVLAFARMREAMDAEEAAESQRGELPFSDGGAS